MTSRLLHLRSLPKAPHATARRKVLTVLTQEILDNPASNAFPIESEHQLCRRFGVSRVTVRLALGDLENRGLIFRRHGKGTFAHGGSTRIYRHIGILSKSPPTTENCNLKEILRGALTVTAPLKAVVSLISFSPEEWPPDFTKSLGGVIVVPQNVTPDEVAELTNRRLPYLIIGKSHLLGAHVLVDKNTSLSAQACDYYAAGRRAAELLSRAALTGERVCDLMIEPILAGPSTGINSVLPPDG